LHGGGLMFIEDRREFPNPYLLKAAERCANRCGRARHAGDIYCIPCRDQITAEAWLKRQRKESAT
jgi:hypothetical protein